MKFDHDTRKLKMMWLLVLMVLWEFVARSGMFNSQLMPTLTEILDALIKGIVSGDLMLQLLQSLVMVLIGVATGFLLSIVMGYLDYYFKVFRSLFELLCAILHPLPGVALLPLMILFFGIGQTAVFMIIIHAVLWPMYMNVKLGFESVDHELVEVAKSNGATKFQLFWFVLFRGSVKALLTGVQIGWSRGWRGLISAEMIFGAINAIGGIGWYIYERRAFMDTKGIYAGILLVVIIGILVEQLVFNSLILHLYNKSVQTKDNHSYSE